MLFLKIVFLYYTMLLAFTRCLLLLLLLKVHHHKIKKRCVAVPHFKMNYYGAIIFLPCGFFYLSSFFSLPNRSGCRLDVYHTSTHGVALVRL